VRREELWANNVDKIEVPKRSQGRPNENGSNMHFNI